MSSVFMIQGSHALVSGASAGIGREFARQLHHAGAFVTIVARREDTLAAFAAELNSLRANSAEILAADLSTTPGTAAVVQYIQAHRIDILVNNAGHGSFGPFEELDLPFEEHMIALNITATVRLAHAVIPQMKARGSGAIVAVSSVAGFQPLPYMATYSGTKVFNLFHALALRQELRKSGVRVLAVCPGPTDTEFFGVARVEGTMTAMRRDNVQTVVAQSLRALQHNKAFVVTGFRSRVMACASRWFPFEISTRLVERVLHSALVRSKKN